MSDTPKADNAELELKQQLANAVTELNDRIKKYDAELQSQKSISEETKSEVLAVEAKLGDLLQQITDMQKSKGRLLDGPSEQPMPTIGEILAGNDDFQEVLKAHTWGSKKLEYGVPVPNGFFKHMKRQLLTKDLTTTTGGAAVDQQRIPGIVDLQFRALTIRDLIPTFPASSNTVEYVRETRWNQLAATLTALAASGQPTIAVDNINGFFVGQSVTLDPGGGNEETLVIDVAGITETDPVTSAGTITFSANLANAQASGTLAVSDEFVFTPETKLKPKSDIELELLSELVKTLAHWIPASRQILADAPGLRQHVDLRLLQGLALEEERQILYGDGTANQLQGIFTDPDTQAYSWSSGISGDTKLDAIRRAMTLAFLAHYPVTGVIVHPTDWEEIETTKGTDGHYIFAGAPGAGAAPLVWRVPVVVTTAVNSGDALVGAFNLGVSLWDREDAMIRVSESHEDFFTRNMVAILGEERITQTLTRPDSFVAVDFDAAP